MTIDEGLLIAWVDGELDHDTAARVAAAVADDPALGAVADAHRALALRLRTGFAPIMAEPVPEAIAEATAAPIAPVIDFESHRVDREARVETRRRHPPVWLALAATLVIGVVIGRGTGFDVSRAAFVDKGGTLVASGPLAKALDDQLASTAGDDPVRITLSFKAQDGHYCRSWALAAQQGVACRSGNDWRIAATAAADDEGRYRMAGGDTGLMARIDSMIAGEPLDATQERAAKDRHWQ